MGNGVQHHIARHRTPSRIPSAASCSTAVSVGQNNCAGDMVGEDSVLLLRHPPVMRAQPRLHMRYRNAALRPPERLQAVELVSPYTMTLYPAFPEQDLFRTHEDFTRLPGMGTRTHIYG